MEGVLKLILAKAEAKMRRGRQRLWRHLVVADGDRNPETAIPLWNFCPPRIAIREQSLPIRWKFKAIRSRKCCGKIGMASKLSQVTLAEPRKKGLTKNFVD